ncbi:MAG: cytochrome c-type biogenesis protein [Pseudomonadota bacterium]
MRVWIKTLFIALTLIVGGQAFAQSTDRTYAPEVEERAREVGKQLRCVVCQNQSIEESDAELAADMRFVVRERLSAGDSEADVIALMRDRYGDYVLLKPPVQMNTIVLWASPLLLVLIFILWWFAAARSKTVEPVVIDLSDDEKERLKQLREQS